jgi:hypothetical protein
MIAANRMPQRTVFKSIIFLAAAPPLSHAQSLDSPLL